MQLITPIVSLNNHETDSFISCLAVKHLEKNQHFLQEGNICDAIGFINYGTMIYYKTSEKGDEITIDFAFEGDWITDNFSRLKQAPSLINIKAIENTELLVLKNDKLTALYDEMPKLEKLGRILTEQAFLRITQLSIDLQVLSAKERYIKLLQQYPTVFQKISLYHITNYLGIAPKSLSRIRNEIVSNK
ncbi:fumarate/nitrate reduction transcriptional regulator [compost metagenome]